MENFESISSILKEFSIKKRSLKRINKLLSNNVWDQVKCITPKLNEIRYLTFSNGTSISFHDINCSSSHVSSSPQTPLVSDQYKSIPMSENLLITDQYSIIDIPSSVVIIPSKSNDNFLEEPFIELESSPKFPPDNQLQSWHRLQNLNSEPFTDINLD